MKRLFLRVVSNALIVACVGGLLLVSQAEAQVSDTQGFTVRIPSRLTISAPTASVLITHDETDNDQAFGAQRWQVRANRWNGATVSFSTDRAFTHDGDAALQRDAKLDLAIGSSSSFANWGVTVASDQTDYGAAVPDGVATVQAMSTRPGRAAFDLTVTFITDEYDTLAEGDYSMTVTGTLMAN